MSLIYLRVKIQDLRELDLEQSQSEFNRNLANPSVCYICTDCGSQSVIAVISFYFISSLGGGAMPLFGIRVLIWTGGGAAGRGCALVTLSLNCSFDFQRENSQSEGEGTPTADDWEV